MKKLLLIALVLTGLTARAQYFQHVYGTANNNEHGVAGINTTGPMPLGQFMVGVGLSCLPVNTVPAVYTDMAGNIPAPPFFNENYILNNGAGSLLTLTGLPKAMEMATCPGMLGIVGAYIDPSAPAPGNSGVFFAQIAPGGGVIAVFNYIPTPGPGFDIVDLTGAKKSIMFPGDWYLTGTAKDNAGVLHPYAMRYNECTGAMVWSQIYNILPPAANAWGRDIEENIMMPFGGPSAAIVGQVTNGPSNDGYMFHINAANGLPSPAPVFIYGSPNSNEDMRSIRQAAAGVFPPGFILGGYTNFNGTVDFMAVRMDFLLAPFFFNTFDYSINPGFDNYCYDAMQRFNSTCVEEYYLVGNTRNGAFGLADGLVIKIDQFGNGLPGGEYTYGGGGNDFTTQIDMRTLVPCGPPPPNFDGISLFGSSTSAPNLGGADMYMVRAYYNGASGCNEKFSNPLQLPPIPLGPQMPVVNIHTLNPSTNINASHYKMQDLTWCFNPMLSYGNNAKVAPKETPADEAMTVLPNPIGVSATGLTVKVESNLDGPATIELFDMLGKLYYRKEHILKKGANNLPVELQSIELAPGMYSVKMSNAAESKTVMLLVQ